MDCIKSVTNNKEFIDSHRNSAADFTRRGVLSFQTVFFMIMGNLRGSLMRELERFWDALGNGAGAPTDSAFCQARMKVMPSAFWEVNHQVTAQFYERRDALRLRGYRLLAIDGSTVRLRGVKAQCANHFAGAGGWDPESGTPLARVSYCYDLLNQIVLDPAIVPYDVGEPLLVEGHLEKLGAGDLLLFDRNYASFRLFASLDHRKLNYCARIKAGQFTQLLGDFLESPETDRTLEWRPAAGQAAQCRELGLPEGPVRVRLVKIVLNTGEIEVLATNLLDRGAWSVEQLGTLYGLRWGVEEEYKRTKIRGEMERWSGKSQRAVEQDFFGRILLENLSAILSSPAREMVEKQTANQKHKHQINRTRALGLTRDILYQLLLATPQKLAGLISPLLEGYSKKPCPIRPGRVYPRNFRPKADFSFPYKAFA